MAKKRALKASLKAGQITPKQYQDRLAKRAARKTTKRLTSKMSQIALSAPSQAIAPRMLDGPRASWTPSTVSAPIVARTPNGLAKAYLASLIDPKNYMSRIPDSFNRKTSLFRTVSSYDVPFSITGGSQRFSAALQPIIGDVSNPSTYQLAIVDNTNPAVTWLPDTDWSAAGTYVSNVGGADPRVDVNAVYLTSPGPAHGDYTVTDTLSASILNFPAKTVGTYTVTANQLYKFNLRNATPTGYQTVQLPLGVWQITVVCTFTPSATVGAGVLIRTDHTATTTTATIVRAVQPVSTATSGVATTVTATFMVSATAGASNIQFAICPFGSATPIAAPTNGSQTNYIVLSNTALPNIPFPASNGAIEEIRPVALSLWASCNASGLLNGGEISAAYVPKDYLTSNYFANSAPGFGNGQLYENLAKVEGAYTGPFKDGAYAWWSPQDMASLQFQSVNDANAADWPALVVSGSFAPLTSVTGSTTGVLRLECCMVFEYITKSTAFEQCALLGSQASIDLANQLLGSETTIHAMPNAKHRSFIDAVLKGAHAVSDVVRANPNLVTAGLSLLGL